MGKKSVTKLLTVSDVAEEAIRLGLDNPDALAYVKKTLPQANTSLGSIKWYRHKLRTDDSSILSSYDARKLKKRKKAA